MRQTLHCRIPNILISPSVDMDISSFSFKVEVEIDDPELKSVFTAPEEQYELNVNVQGAKLRSITYVGFLRGL